MTRKKSAELRCVNDCAVLELMPAQDVRVCPVCTFGVTGLEIATNRGRDLQRLINDGLVGHRGVLVTAPDREERVTRELPRRNYVDLMVPAEKAILEAIRAVEELPADVRLTDAVILLGHAKDKVSDFVDRDVATEKVGA